MAGYVLATPRTSSRNYWCLTNSVLNKPQIPIIPPLLDTPAISSLISDATIFEEKAMNIMRSLNLIKAHGWGEISIRMIKLIDVSLVTPLKIIFENCLRNDKTNYSTVPFLFYQFLGKILEKPVYDSLFPRLVSCNFLHPNQSGFWPSNSTINQLISKTHSIYKAFDFNLPLDVRSAYLDISRAFEKVGMMASFIR